MPDKDINYKSELSSVTIASIKADVQSKLNARLTEYDNILASFSISQCAQATAVRNMILKEKEIINALESFYTNLLTMLQNAGKDLERTEGVYNSSHIKSDNDMRGKR